MGNYIWESKTEYDMVMTGIYWSDFLSDRQINFVVFVVLDERCAMACRNLTAILLLAEFHLQAAFIKT